MEAQRRGQVIVESIIAISVGIVGLLAVLHLLTRTIAYNREVGQRFVATYLAAEGIEIVRNLVDTNTVRARTVPGTTWDKHLLEGSYEFDYTSACPGADCVTFTDPLSTTRLWFDGSTGAYFYRQGNPNGAASPYTRTIQIRKNSLPNNIGPGGVVKVIELQVDSIVRWSERSGAKEVRLQDHFFDWRSL